MTDVERYVTNDQIDLMWRCANAFALSGMFQDAKDAAQAYVKISAGAEMGLLPFESMSGIAVIEGKPVVGAALLAGSVKASEKYDYAVLERSDDRCALMFYEGGEEAGPSVFTMADAKRAGLDRKNVWQKYPANMLFARAMSNGVATYCPDVTRSRVRIYVEGELDDLEGSARRPARGRRNVIDAETTTAPVALVAAAEVQDVAPDAEGVGASDDPGEIRDVPVLTAAATEDSRTAGTLNVTTTGPAQPLADLVQADPPVATLVPDPVQDCAAVLRGYTKEQRQLVQDVCGHLGIAWDATTPLRLVERFGDAATKDATLRATLVEATRVPAVGTAAGEIEQGAQVFQDWLDSQQPAEPQPTLLDGTDLAIREADAARERIAERMRDAGTYGTGR